MKKKLALFCALFLLVISLSYFVFAQAVCGPSFSDPASLFNVKIVPFAASFNISAGFDCPVDFVEISRCQGSCSALSSFNIIHKLSSQNNQVNFIDDAGVWGSNYTYSVRAKYSYGSFSDLKLVSAYSGDVECKDISQNIFCLNNKAWSCDINNLLVKPSTLDCSSQANTVCVSDGISAKCSAKVACDSVNSQPFGLYSNKDSCEKNNFCFYDKSKTIINKCYNCDSRMSCYDYKSSDSCTRDNCGVGNCVWKDLIPGLGIGNCVSSKKSNCLWCDKPGSGFVDSSEAFNPVFDLCSQEKSDLLSEKDKCLVDLQAPKKLGKSCLDADCSSYTQSQCGVDPCSIGVCDFDSSTGCSKNFARKSTTSANWQDCLNKPDRVSCEKDFSPPDTRAFVLNSNGTASKIVFNVFDKLNSTDAGSYKIKEGLQTANYKVKVCLIDVINPLNCNSASNFAKETNDAELFVNNQELKDKNNNLLFNLNNGLNELKFFAIDSYENTENVKSINFTACSGCSGPTITLFNLSNGRKQGNIWYSRDKTPRINIAFSALSSLIQYELRKNNSLINIDASPTAGAFATNFILTPPQDLDGEYSLALNAKTQTNVPMSYSINERIIIDSINPGLTISPANSAVVANAKNDVQLSFSEPVIINKVIILEEQFSSDFESDISEIDATNDLRPSLDKKNFTYYPLQDLKDGKHTVKVSAEDFAGNIIIQESVFFISTKPLKIKLSKPSYGFSNKNSFDLEFETSIPTFCQYVFNHAFVLNPDIRTPVHKAFTSTNNNTHALKNFDKITTDNEKYLFQVFCDDPTITSTPKVTTQVFYVEIDKIPLNIISKKALPSIIVEKEASGLYETDLEIKTNKIAFCKHDVSSTDFNLMKGLFSSYQTNKARNTHVATLNVSSVGNYSYFISCKGVNDVLSQLDIIGFSVDPSQPFKIFSKTPALSGNSTYKLLFETNKRAVCYYSDDAKKQKTQVSSSSGGSSSWIKNHFQTIDVGSKLINGVGNLSYYLTCYDSIQSPANAEGNVFVDTTPPEMSSVDTKTPNQFIDATNAYTTWENSRFRSSFKGEDIDSGIDYYEYRLFNPIYLNASDPSRESFINPAQPVIGWFISRVIDGSQIIITQDDLGRPFILDNSTDYLFEVRAVNNAGLKSSVMSDQNVFIDTSLTPPHCSNFLKDADEVDEDCGGSCKPCDINKACKLDNDCTSKLCLNSICTQPTCNDDYITLIFESDKGCGGSGCPLCDLGKKCFKSSDCSSNHCSSGICELPVPCYDKTEKCTVNEGCRGDSDCQTGLKCMSNTCSIFNDDDRDGIVNDNDDCANTKTGKRVNDHGCAICDDDVDDSWRERYFGSVNCNDNIQLASSDPDNDGLTNLEESKANTDPNKNDTDDDGYSDSRELKSGSDPLNPESKPKINPIYWIIIGVVAVLVIVIGGFFGHKKIITPYLARRRLRAFEASRIPPPEKKDVSESISKLREIAKEKKDEPEYIALADLPEKIMKTPEVIFNKLKEIAKRK